MLNRLIDLQRFIYKHVHRGESPVVGAIPRPTQPAANLMGQPHCVERRRRIMTEGEIRRLRVYGLAVHHVEDCFDLMG